MNAEANGAAGELPEGMADVTAQHPKEIQGHKVRQVLESACGCRAYYFETEGVAVEAEPCVPHAMRDAGLALLAGAARMSKELEAAAAAQASPILHTPDMGGGKYGRGPR